MIEEALVARLKQSPAVTALIGSGDDARVYPVELPQAEAFPAITYQVISGAPVRTTDGPRDLAFAHLQVDCWATTYAAVLSLRNAVRRAIDGWQGYAYGCNVNSIEMSGDRDERLGDLRLFRRSFDVEAWYREQ